MSLIAYGTALVVLAVADGLWLSWAGKQFFDPAVGSLLAENTNYVAAVIFYLLYPLGILLFAVSPALKEASLLTALFYGAAFGFFVYMTYDMTNMAILKVWPVHLAVIDVSWGTFVTALSSGVAYLVASRFT